MYYFLILCNVLKWNLFRSNLYTKSSSWVAGGDQNPEAEESASSGLRQLHLHCLRPQCLWHSWQECAVPAHQQNRWDTKAASLCTESCVILASSCYIWAVQQVRNYTRATPQKQLSKERAPRLLSPQVLCGLIISELWVLHVLLSMLRLLHLEACCYISPPSSVDGWRNRPGADVFTTGLAVNSVHGKTIFLRKWPCGSLCSLSVSVGFTWHVTAAKTWPLRNPLKNEQSRQTFPSSHLCFSIFLLPLQRLAHFLTLSYFFMSLSVFLVADWLIMMITQFWGLTDCCANLKALASQHAGVCLDYIDWMWSPGVLWV